MSEPNQQRESLESLEKTDGSSATSFEQWLKAIDGYHDRRCERLVSRLTSSDVPAVVALYVRGGENRRWWAVRALAELSAEAEAGLVIEAMADPSADIRTVAAYSAAHMAQRLGEGNAKFAVELLAALAKLLLDDLGFVRQAAADALAQSGEVAVPVLRTVLAGRDESARTRAAYALSKIRSRQAIADFYAHLDDANPMVRLYAREALIEMGMLEMVYFQPV